jgi:4-amino-4-deoxy-L-arabinose transferase-like glycosyltransferase
VRAWSAHVLALALATGAVGHALWSASQEGWTYDEEAFHLQWAERFLDTGISERVSQERFNSKTPIMLPGVLVRKAARAAGVTEVRTLRFFARAPSVLWLALLLGLVYAAGRTVGPAAGALAVTGAALDPNLVAHASLATSDVPFACATLATLFAAHRLWERPSPARSAMFGAALGTALVAKVTAFVLLPGLVALPFLGPSAENTTRWRRRLLLLGGAIFCAWVTVCAAYLLREMGLPLGAMDLRSRMFLRAASMFPGLRVPLPAPFLTTFDATLATDHPEWNVVAAGRQYPNGVWWYFALLWALKTPVLLLVVQAWGLARAAGDSALHRHPLLRLLAVNLVFFLVYFSLLFRVQVGYRYMLMALPLAYVIAGAGLASLPPRRRWTIFGGLVVVTALAENAVYLGNPLSFTNAAVQPKRLAYRLLADSNLDWGQNRERLAGWLAEREWNAARVDPVHLLPGRNVIDLNALAGVFDFEQYRWVREHLEPGGHLGHTYLWYLVDDDTFNRYLYDSRRLFPDPFASTVCPDSLAYSVQPNGSEVPVNLRRMPRPDETSVACVVARRDTDVGFRVTKGSADVGVLVAPGECRTQAVQEGQEVWWRLEPGTYALCLVTQPYRRTWLPYALDGAWRVRGWGVRVALRPLIPEPTPPPPAATSPRSSSPPRPPGD